MKDSAFYHFHSHSALLIKLSLKRIEVLLNANSKRSKNSIINMFIMVGYEATDYS